jgi:radical SAM superfamily enzyme YgiQ (UPF0313 family)
MSVLLVEPKCLSRFSSDAYSPVNQLNKKTFLSPPLGLAYLAAVLKKAGIDVIAIDLNLFDDPFLDLIGKINETKPAIIGISGNFSRNINHCLALNNQIKNFFPGIITVFGGNHSTARWHDLLEAGVDVVVLYEGENTFLELVKTLLSSGKNNLSKICGIAYKEKKNFVKTPPRPLIDDLDSLPFPCFEVFSLNEYGMHKKYPIMSSRGCNLRCYYCAACAFSQYQIRVRTAANIKEEIAQAKNTGGFEYFNFCDDNLAFSPKRIDDLCTAIKSLGVKWSANCYPLSLSEVMLEKMKAAGCNLIFVGVESGSPDVLNKVKPGISREKIEDVVTSGRKLGLDIVSGFMFPHYNDTLQSIEETRQFMRKLSFMGATVILTMTTPFPGTKLFENPEGFKINIFEFDWDKYDLRHPTFETSAFDRYLIAKKFADLEKVSFESVVERVKPVLKDVFGINPEMLKDKDVMDIFQRYTGL